MTKIPMTSSYSYPDGWGGLKGTWAYYSYLIVIDNPMMNIMHNNLTASVIELYNTVVTDSLYFSSVAIDGWSWNMYVST